LAEQNRTFGNARGAITASAGVSISSAATKNVVNLENTTLKSTDISAILNKYACSACHGIDNKLVGPSFKDIAAKQGARADAVAYLSGKIKNGSTGVYGNLPMPPQSLGEAELADIVRWIVSGATK
jgi:S-disulfanyl-L-cysteine oxidoreductase SoxD